MITISPALRRLVAVSIWMALFACMYSTQPASAQSAMPTANQDCMRYMQYLRASGQRNGDPTTDYAACTQAPVAGSTPAVAPLSATDSVETVAPARAAKSQGCASAPYGMSSYMFQLLDVTLRNTMDGLDVRQLREAVQTLERTFFSAACRAHRSAAALRRAAGLSGISIDEARGMDVEALANAMVTGIVARMQAASQPPDDHSSGLYGILGCYGAAGCRFVMQTAYQSWSACQQAINTMGMRSIGDIQYSCVPVAISQYSSN